MTDEASGNMPDEYDRLLGQLRGLVGVTHTNPSQFLAMPTMGVGGSTTFIVQTFRQRDEPAGDSEADRKAIKSRDVCFLVIAGPTGYHRHVLPQEVLDAILRQRESLGTKVRRKVAKRVMAARMATGWKPNFGKRKRGSKK